MLKKSNKFFPKFSIYIYIYIYSSPFQWWDNSFSSGVGKGKGTTNM
jgi:hypothetical protein